MSSAPAPFSPVFPSNAVSKSGVDTPDATASAASAVRKLLTMASVRHDVDIATACAQMLLYLVNDILDLSKFENGQVHAHARMNTKSFFVRVVVDSR